MSCTLQACLQSKDNAIYYGLYREGNEQSNTKKLLDAEQYDRSQPEGSFAESDQNHAQNSGSNDANDTLHSLQGRKEPKVLKYHESMDFENNPDLVYIGRAYNRLGLKGSKWGNQFEIRKDGTREEVIRKYMVDTWNNPPLYRAIFTELPGRNLVCWCAPESCHGDWLLRVANSKYVCYYCIDFQSTNYESDYKNNVVLKHMTSSADKDHPAYPTKADIERLGLVAQGKSWEI